MACVAVGVALLSSAGCGGGSAAKPAGTSAAVASTALAAATTPTAASPGRTFTADQLLAALLTDAEVPHTKLNPAGESDAINTHQDIVGTGDAGCQKFVDATELLGQTYGVLTEDTRDLLGATKADIHYGLTLAVLSGSGATQVMADIRSGLAGCHSIYTMADTTAGTLKGSDDEVPVASLGDASIGYLQWDTIAGLITSHWASSYSEFVQVGAAIVEVRDFPEGYAPIDAGKLQAQLAAVVKAQVAKLQAA